MRKQIGIIIPPAQSGGVMQYALTIGYSLLAYSKKYHYTLLYDKSENILPSLPASLHSYTLAVPAQRLSPVHKLLHFTQLWLADTSTVVKNTYVFLKNHAFDMLIFPAPFTFILPYTIPYILGIPDLMHKYLPQLEEYSIWTRIKRDIVYGYFLRHSLINVVDSKQGAEDLFTFFDTPKDKIRTIPFMPAQYVYMHKDMAIDQAEKILAPHKLPPKFLFYPAQLWPHKNHKRLIEAIADIKQECYLCIPLILVGSHSRRSRQTRQEVNGLIKKNGLQNQIILLGYVSEKEIVALYKTAWALVFPTLIGPTSIPPLEAMLLGTPVLCSNLFEMPKQIGDAGLLFNPYDICDIKEKILAIWNDKTLRTQLISKGYERTCDLTLSTYAALWENVIDEALKLI